MGGGVAGRGDVGNSEKRKERKPQQRCIIELVTRGSWDSVPLGPPLRSHGKCTSELSTQGTEEGSISPLAPVLHRSRIVP